MKRILIFSTTYFPYVGGAELAVKEITDRISYIDFDMITLRFDKNLPIFERIGNINVYRVGFSKYGATDQDLVSWPLKLNKYLFPVFALWKTLGTTLGTKSPIGDLVPKQARFSKESMKYDLVWSIMASYAGFAGLLYKLFNPKISFLLTLQEGDPLEFYKKRVGVFNGLYKMIFRKADKITAISNFLAKYGKEMGFKGEVAVIPNGVDIINFTRDIKTDESGELKNKIGKREGDVFLVTASRLVLKNAVDDIIRALEYLPENFRLLVLGDGPDREKLQNIAGLHTDESLTLGMPRVKLSSERVIFLGHVGHEDLPKYLKISDIFIRPSLSEGLGNSFLEAMAAGIPVIATPVGGIPDFLFDPDKNPDKESTGLFCEIRNPESIAKQVLRLIENSELRARIINNAKAMTIKKYDWDKISQEFKSVYK